VSVGVSASTWFQEACIIQKAASRRTNSRLEKHLRTCGSRASGHARGRGRAELLGVLRFPVQPATFHSVRDEEAVKVVRQRDQLEAGFAAAGAPTCAPSARRTPCCCWWQLLLCMHSKFDRIGRAPDGSPSPRPKNVCGMATRIVRADFDWAQRAGRWGARTHCPARTACWALSHPEQVIRWYQEPAVHGGDR
jgi:hypothetical protein